MPATRGELHCRETTYAKGASAVAIGGGLYAPDRFEAVFDEDVSLEEIDFRAMPLEELPPDLPRFLDERADAVRAAPRITIDVEVVNGRPRCRGLRFKQTGRPIVSDDTRLPLARMLTAALEMTAFRFDGEALHFTDPANVDERFRRAAEAKLKAADTRPRTNAITDEHLEAVTTVYRKGLENLDPPTRAVAAHFGTPIETARRWVSRARARYLEAQERGEPNPLRFLGPTLPGKKGEGLQRRGW